jgi:hypothetical protein
MPNNDAQFEAEMARRRKESRLFAKQFTEWKENTPEGKQYAKNEIAMLAKFGKKSLTDWEYGKREQLRKKNRRLLGKEAARRAKSQGSEVKSWKPWGQKAYSTNEEYTSGESTYDERQGTLQEYEQSDRYKKEQELAGLTKEQRKALEDRRKEYGQTFGVEKARLQSLMRAYSPAEGNSVVGVEWGKTGIERKHNKSFTMEDLQNYEDARNAFQDFQQTGRQKTWLSADPGTAIPDWLKNLGQEAPASAPEQQQQPTKAEQSIIANPYEASAATIDAPFNTAATRANSAGQSGIIGNTKAGDKVYNPKTAVRNKIQQRMTARRNQKRQNVLSRSKERIQ